MKLNVRMLEIAGETFEARELPIKALMPLIGKLQNDPDGTAQFQLVGLSIHKDGVPLGEAVGEVGASTYMAFQAAVLDINGMNGKVGNG